jgi:hypothetical protein
MPGQSRASGGEGMRVKIENVPPTRGQGTRKWEPVFASACAWPRSRYAHPGRGTSQWQERKDRAEVAAYMRANPGCSTDDIAMCCHMSPNQAARLKGIVEGKG